MKAVIRSAGIFFAKLKIQEDILSRISENCAWKESKRLEKTSPERDAEREFIFLEINGTASL